MEQKKTIHQIVRISSKKELFDWLPDEVIEGFSAVCVSLFVAAPLVMSVVAMVHRNIDYTAWFHPHMMRGRIFPLAFLTGGLAILLDISRYRHRKGCITSWIWKNPVFICFLFIAVWMIVSTIVNGLNETLILGVAMRHESILMQFGYFLILFPTATLIKRWTVKIALVRGFLLVSIVLVLAAFVLWHTQTESTFFRDWSPRFSSIYTNINYYGYILAMAVPLSAAMLTEEEKPLWRSLALAALAANSIALALNQTMGAWVACIFGMGFLAVTRRLVEKRRNSRVLPAIVVFVLSFAIAGCLGGTLQNNFTQLGRDIVLVVSHGEELSPVVGQTDELSEITAPSQEVGHVGSGRGVIWRNAIILISRNPVFGIGFDGVAAQGLEVFARNTRPHNEYLQYALFYGIPAGIAYFAGCLGVFLRGLRYRGSLDGVTLACLTAAFGYLVSAFFGLTLYCTAPFLFLFLGMGYVQPKVNYHQKGENNGSEAMYEL